MAILVPWTTNCIEKYNAETVFSIEGRVNTVFQLSHHSNNVIFRWINGTQWGCGGGYSMRKGNVRIRERYYSFLI
jgi:hypothetical protein